MTQVWPGGTIGILGGGQLARMLTLEAHRMGYRTAVMDPDPEGPAAQIADICVSCAFDDPQGAMKLAEQSDVVTLDTEQIPASHLEQIAAVRPVHPSAEVLRIVQDRLTQRRFLEAQGVWQVRYAPVSDMDSLHAAAKITGFPCVLKARRSGYDGKGQIRVGQPDGLVGAWKALGESPAVMESFVDFEREIAVLLARDVYGNLRFHPIAENVHRRHILRLTRVPAQISAKLTSQAEELGAQIASALGHVGMMAIELFVTGSDALWVNEIAPRVHNSGHYSFGACVTSQFAQHIRAISGLSLGDPSLLMPAVMVNLLGDLWADGSPAWDTVMAHPTAHLHLYGKKRASAGRKMGHILVVDPDVDHAHQVAEAIMAELGHPVHEVAKERAWTS